MSHSPAPVARTTHFLEDPVRVRSVTTILGTAALTALAAGLLPPTAAAAPAARSAVIVTLDDAGAAPAAVARLAEGLGGQVGHVYTDALRGFSVELPTTALPALRALPGVVAVEADGVVRAVATQSPVPSYGLDRVDQRALPLSGGFTYADTGAGVTAYIIDTGIRRDHVDFSGRAVSGYDAVTSGGSANDCNGHGTHAAGTVGGEAHGVAKDVTLVAVRVLDCGGSGSTSGVIAGVDWVARHHAAGEPAVANMSLGGGASSALDSAVRGAIADGVTFAVAAGNDGGLLGELTGAADACNGSPSRVAEALTVGASDKSDNKASYSNRGPCLDLFAPGSSIVSAWHTSSTATSSLSGTSMAAPHVAGVAAQYLQGAPSASPATVGQHIVSTATTGAVKNPGSGSPNRLLFTAE
ncbi:MAG TPA: S8 family serine peptidase [Mycobacteriales bacterium]|nr:S8 family serine peptidase [Mycobacteriales bacterium]